MTKKQYNKLIRIQAELNELVDLISDTKYDCELHYGNGLESEQIECASAALETILQELD